jgi:hypothetical protein
MCKIKNKWVAELVSTVRVEGGSWMKMDKNQIFGGCCCGLGKLWVECGVNERGWWCVGSGNGNLFRYGW